MIHLIALFFLHTSERLFSFFLQTMWQWCCAPMLLAEAQDPQWLPWGSPMGRLSRRLSLLPCPCWGAGLWGCPARISGGAGQGILHSAVSRWNYIWNTLRASHWSLILGEEDRAGLVGFMCRGTVHTQWQDLDTREPQGCLLAFRNCVCVRRPTWL